MMNMIEHDEVKVHVKGKNCSEFTESTERLKEALIIPDRIESVSPSITFCSAST